MKSLRCERQSLALQAMTAVSGTATVLFVLAVLDRIGFSPLFAVLALVMVFYAWNGLRGTIEALSVYRFDEEHVERRHPLRRERLRWADVRALRIRRSSGDATFFLKDGSGSRLRLDFQLLGDGGGELLQLALRKLAPLVEAELERIEREPRSFPRRHMGFIPLPGSVRAGAGTIRAAGGTVRLDFVREVVVKEVKKLVATQEYLVKGDAGRVRFSCYVDDSPLLLKYLRRHIPEERWTIGRSSGVFLAKLNALLLVPLMALCALLMLSQDARGLAVERALAARSQSVEGTALGAQSLGRARYLLEYKFPVPEGRGGLAGEDREQFGMVEVRGEPPAPGRTIRIQFDPERPHLSRPEQGQGIEMPNVWALVGISVVLLLLSIPWAASVLAYKVRRDPFEEWIFAEPTATGATSPSRP